MAKILIVAALVLVVLGVFGLYLLSKVYQRRERRLDAEAIASTPGNKHRAEKAQEEEHRIQDTTISVDDEKVWERTEREFEAKWGAFMSEAPNKWAREKLTQDFQEIHEIYDRYEQDRLSIYDKYSCRIGGYSSATELRVETMLREHTGDYKAVTEQIEAEYVDHVSTTYRWTNADQALLEAMLDEESLTKA